MGMYVQEVGPAGAPTIVLLHGGGVGGWMWRDTMAAPSEVHLLIPDMPEHGKSQDAGPFSVAGTVRLVADLIAERAHGGKAFVAGLSLGAQVTVALLVLGRTSFLARSRRERWYAPSPASGS
jgi:pimeloyl-ACP methyl ester carboxylesterase